MKKTLLLAALLTLGLAANAHALDGRIADDPCTGAQTHFELKWDTYGLQCNATFEIPPHRTWADPISQSDGECPWRWYMVNEGAWDYWTYRGEWVTWNGWFREAPHLGSNDEALSRRTFFVAPYYHNWSSWNWPTRTIEHCHGDRPRPKALAASTAGAAERGQAIDLGAGDDVDHATDHTDHVKGGPGDDRLFGEGGDDQLLGGAGADDLWGGEGSDELFDDHGKDHLHGGPGNDRFSTKDGNHDVVDCGPGEDIAIGDPHDTFTDCEHVYTTPANTPDAPPEI